MAIDFDWRVKIVDLKSLRHMAVRPRRVDARFSTFQLLEGQYFPYKSDAKCHEPRHCHHCFKMFHLPEHNCTNSLLADRPVVHSSMHLQASVLDTQPPRWCA